VVSLTNGRPEQLGEKFFEIVAEDKEFSWVNFSKIPNHFIHDLLNKFNSGRESDRKGKRNLRDFLPTR